MSSFEYLKIAWYYFSLWGKRLILFFLVLSIILAFFLHFLGQDKQALRTNNSIEKEQTKLLYTTLNDPKLQETKQGRVVAKLYSGFLCWSIGEVCTSNPADAPKYLSQSITGKMASLIVLPIVNPPASGVYWASETLKDAGFIPKTYAAEGIGFAALKPIMNLWKVFRDISYMLLVLVLVVIGFMIMFRMKLNPQTVINVENALPKIVVSMILITFSFAISGFLIDLMYVLIAIIVSILSNNNAYFDAAKTQNLYLNGNGLNLWDSIYANPAGGFKGSFSTLNSIGMALYDTVLKALPATVAGTIRFMLTYITGSILSWIINIFVTAIAGKPFQEIGAGILGNVLFGGKLTDLLTIPIILIASTILGFLTSWVIIPLLFGAAIFFTLLFLYLRIFMMLFRAYLQILFLIILSPFILLFEAIPGKSSFSFWLKNLFAEIATFPIVILILTIGFVLSSQLTIQGGFWRPPFINSIDPTFLPILIGMGIIMMTPDLVKLAKEQLFGVKGLPVNFGLGTYFAGVGVAGGGLMSGLGTLSTINMGGAAFFGQDWMKKGAAGIGAKLVNLKNKQAATNDPKDVAVEG